MKLLADEPLDAAVAFSDASQNHSGTCKYRHVTFVNNKFLFAILMPQFSCQIIHHKKVLAMTTKKLMREGGGVSGTSNNWTRIVHRGEQETTVFTYLLKLV